MSTWCRNVHVSPHCSFLTEACSCRLEVAYFAGKISKNRLVCKNAVALAHYGSCRLQVMGSCFYIRPSFLKSNTPFFSIGIHFSTSTFVLFNLNIPFLSSTFVLSVVVWARPGNNSRSDWLLRNGCISISKVATGVAVRDKPRRQPLTLIQDGGRCSEAWQNKTRLWRLGPLLPWIGADTYVVCKNRDLLIVLDKKSFD